jgi:hypothetical protein
MIVTVEILCKPFYINPNPFFHNTKTKHCRDPSCIGTANDTHEFIYFFLTTGNILLLEKTIRQQ